MNKLFEALAKAKFKVTSASDAARIIGWVDSGNYALNWAISNRFSRGWPLGHVAEIFGPPQTGKSYLTFRAIAEVQKMGGEALIDDVECSFNSEWAERALGVNAHELMYRRSPTIEQHYEVVSAFTTAVAEFETTDGPFVLVLDSLANLATERELKDEFKTADFGWRAKQITRLFREMGVRLGGLPIAYLITNHVLESYDAFTPPTTPGGKMKEYVAHTRLYLRTIRKIKDSTGGLVGATVRAEVFKTRLTITGKKVEIIIPFYQPISRYSGLIPVLLTVGVVSAPAQTILIDGKSTGIKAFKSDPIRQQAAAEVLAEKFPVLEKAEEAFIEHEQMARLPSLLEEEKEDAKEDS